MRRWIARLVAFAAPTWTSFSCHHYYLSISFLSAPFAFSKVAWLRVESKTILTIHHHIITRNYRIGLSHSDDRQWNLHLNDVHESDRGGYMCQINTVPMKYQVGFLDVVGESAFLVVSPSFAPRIHPRPLLSRLRRRRRASRVEPHAVLKRLDDPTALIVSARNVSRVDTR